MNTLLPDFVSEVLSAQSARGVIITVIWLDAFLMAFLAFTLTQDAGFRCPLALLRLVHRWAMAMFAISLGYLAAWLMQTPERYPSGPALLVFVSLLFSILPAAIRLSLTPSIAAENNWHGVIRWLFHRHQTPAAKNGPQLPINGR